ncbi:MAG: YkgJ family cysteine cluster protein [Myxococcales bacterium]|nr:YkgJ family cysteine cluster protein [Myxococcales bacterium]
MSTPYAALVAKVDAFVARVEARHAADLRCGPGCATCCHARLTVTGVEAAAIRAWLAAQPVAARAAIAAAAATAAPDRCAALDADDRCRIYAVRPLVCRSHGVPIRLRQGSLPVVTSCALNFAARGPAAADADCILDQELVSTTLGVIDRAAGGAPAARVELAALLISG